MQFTARLYVGEMLSLKKINSVRRRKAHLFLVMLLTLQGAVEASTNTGECGRKVPGFNIRYEKADILPKTVDAFYLPGQSFELSCQIRKECLSEMEKATILFYWSVNRGDEYSQLPAKWVTPSGGDGRKGAILKHPGFNLTTGSHQELRFRCVKMNGSIPEKLARRVVQIGELPERITNITCISHNMMDMKCVFCKQEPFEGPDIWTRYNITWKMIGFKTWYSDTLIYEDGCYVHVWPKHHNEVPDKRFKALKNYTIDIVIINRWHELYMQNQTVETVGFNVSSTSIVKPDPVSEVDIQPVSGWVSTVTWKDPDDLSWAFLHIGGLRSRVTYTPLLGGQGSTIDVNRGRSVQLNGLTPASEYRVSVSCRPGNGGYWSDPLNKTFRTPAEAPGMSPVTSSGVYNLISCGSFCHRIQIYWGDIPAGSRHGEILGYNVTMVNDEGIVMESREVPASQYTHTFPALHTPHPADKLQAGGAHPADKLRAGGALYHITLTGYNEAGPSPPDTWSVNLTKHFPSPRDVVGDRLSAGEVEFNWTPPDLRSMPSNARLSHYTLFSCPSGDTSHCQGPAAYVRIDSNLTSYVALVPEAPALHSLIANYIHADGSEARVTMSSGLTPWICVFETATLTEENVKARQLEITVEEKDGNLEFSWEKYSCETVGVRIQSYYIIIKADSQDLLERELGGESEMFSLPDYSHHTKYELELQGRANGFMVLKAHHIYHTAYDTRSLLFITFGVIAILIFAFGLLYGMLRLRKRMQGDIPIDLPELVNTQVMLSGSQRELDQCMYDDIGKGLKGQAGCTTSTHSSSSGYGDSVANSTPPYPQSTPPLNARAAQQPDSQESAPLLEHASSTEKEPVEDPSSSGGSSKPESSIISRYVLSGPRVMPGPYVQPLDYIPNRSFFREPVENSDGGMTDSGGRVGSGDPEQRWDSSDRNTGAYCMESSPGAAGLGDRKSTSSSNSMRSEFYCGMDCDGEEDPPATPTHSESGGYCGLNTAVPGGRARHTDSGSDLDTAYCDNTAIRRSPIQFDRMTGSPKPPMPCSEEHLPGCEAGDTDESSDSRSAESGDASDGESHPAPTYPVSLDIGEDFSIPVDHVDPISPSQRLLPHLH